jgi:hypothetical protein
MHVKRRHTSFVSSAGLEVFDNVWYQNGYDASNVMVLLTSTACVAFLLQSLTESNTTSRRLHTLKRVSEITLWVSASALTKAKAHAPAHERTCTFKRSSKKFSSSFRSLVRAHVDCKAALSSSKAASRAAIEAACVEPMVVHHTLFCM